jgi:hypothetical protein
MIHHFPGEAFCFSFSVVSARLPGEGRGSSVGFHSIVGYATAS